MAAKVKPSYECNDFADIAKCFEKLHTYINNEVDALKAKQEITEKKADVIESSVEYFNTEFQELHNTHLPNLEAKIEAEQIERTKLELWGRKWNVVIRGVSGAVVTREFPKVTEARVRQFLKDTLKFEEGRAKSMLFTAVHRLPSGEPNKRNIILRLSSLIDRDDILQAATQLQPGSGYSVVPDLPPPLATLRGNLLKERKDMSPEEKKKCKLVYLKDPPFVKLVTRSN